MLFWVRIDTTLTGSKKNEDVAEMEAAGEASPECVDELMKGPTFDFAGVPMGVELDKGCAEFAGAPKPKKRVRTARCCSAPPHQMCTSRFPISHRLAPCSFEELRVGSATPPS
eukprot:1171651-Alexandrium_andersonii.AAC.1